jgi:hypothetical protein
MEYIILQAEWTQYDKKNKLDKMKPLIICTTVLIEKSPQALPLGAACIASALKHDDVTAENYSVMLTSITAEDTGYADACNSGTTGSFIAAAILASGKPAIVCFSVYVWNRIVLEQAAGELKRRIPGLVCIAGGPEITADPFSSEAFDYTIAGEGEVAVPGLVARLASGAAGSLPPGVYIPGKENGVARTLTFVHAPAPDIGKTASPWLDGTIDPSRYGGALWELARGCPFKCSYCYESKGEKKVRYFPMERIEQELDFFAQKKVPQVFVLDPTYNADKKRALRILRLIAEKTPDTFFYFECRAEFIDKEMAKAFTAIPCALQIGLQSAHEDVLEKVHRTLNKKLFVKNIGILNETGAVFGFDLIYGLPGDSLTGFRESIDFAVSLYPNNLETFCLSVLPGTDLYDNAENLGLVWDKNPPYHVLHTDKFSETDIARAEKLSCSCSFFYNQGRAVPWFNSVLYPLRTRASAFFADFAAWWDVTGHVRTLEDENSRCLPHGQIEQSQLDFVKAKYMEKNLAALLPAAEDIIRLNGALSRTQADGITQTLRTRYHPDDIMSEYATDIGYFAKNAKKHPYTVQTFMSNHGADWKTI